MVRKSKRIKNRQRRQRRNAQLAAEDAANWATEYAAGEETGCTTLRRSRRIKDRQELHALWATEDAAGEETDGAAGEETECTTLRRSRRIKDRQERKQREEALWATEGVADEEITEGEADEDLEGGFPYEWYSSILNELERQTELLKVFDQSHNHRRTSNVTVYRVLYS